MQQRTVGDAFRAAADFISIHSETSTATIEPLGDDVLIWVDLNREPDGLSYDRAQGNELTLASPIFVFRWLMKRDWWPLQVGLTHPARGSLDRYKRYFGQIPLFDQDRMYFVCRASDMDILIGDFDPEAERVARRIANDMLPVSHESFRGAVELTIRQKLAEGTLNAETVAAALDLDLRTMQRRLAAENASFSELLDLTRRDLARTFVENSRRPLSDVAELLGFQSLSAFSQWYGKTHHRSAAEVRSGRRLS
jgi:AraC-like DNA-binding protein